jgi:hypothetical protein
MAGPSNEKKKKYEESLERSLKKPAAITLGKAMFDQWLFSRRMRHIDRCEPEVTQPLSLRF